MKKIISTVLLFAMVLSLLAGCTLVPAKEPTATLEDAKQFLVNYFMGTSATTDIDYKIPGSIKINETVFNVVWTTDNESIKVVPQEDGKVLIDLPELGAEEVTYTLTATITLDGTEGNITYSRTCKISASAASGKTPEQIVEEIYQLPDAKEDENAAVMENVTLTGKIVAINAAYTEAKGITVIMQIGNLTDKPITAYQLKVAAGEAELSAALASLLPGDTITVNGKVKNYGGTYEFDKGCKMIAYTKGTPVTAPTDPAQIVADAKALAENQGLPYIATLTGSVTSIVSNFDDQYNNLSVNIKVGDTFILCYRLVGSEGANIVVGDTITVTGPIMNYKGGIQFVESSTLVSRTAGEGGGNVELDLPANAVLQISGAYITGTESLYAAKNKIQLITSTNIADAIAFTLIKNDDGTVSFKTNDGYFLFCDATDVKFVTEEGDYTKFVIELTNNGYYIKCANATFNGNAQYLEYYNNILTCYGLGSDLTQFTFTFAETTGANGTVVKYVAPDTDEPGTGEDPENPGTNPEIPEKVVLKIKGVYITGTESLYAAKNKLQLITSANIADAIAFTVIENADGTVSFKTNDGYFLFCDATDVKFVTAEDDNTKFVLEATTGGYFIKCAVANYNGKAQYLEYYNNILTSFGMAADTSIYTFTFEDTTGANGTVVKYVAPDTDEPGTGEDPENPGTGEDPEQPGTGTEPENPSSVKGSADFSTFDNVAANSGGDSGYTKTHTTTNGWTSVNSAIQAGGTSDVNPNFKVFGPDKTYKAVCLNGKTSAVGKLTSPTLSGGISKLTFNYTKCFTDTKLGITVTITDLATGTAYTKDLDVELDKNDKYTVYDFEFVLGTPIAGDFTIEIVNKCPTGQDGNKDRISIWNLNWY